MLIYNVTMNVDHEIVADWLQWMKNVHIPDVMATGKFTEYRMLRMTGQADSGLTYAIQYTCTDHTTLNDYMANHAPALQKEHNERYGHKAVGFRTVLEIID